MTLDNRISYGCIKVPVEFYESVVRPLFDSSGIVYILPETRSKTYSSRRRTRQRRSNRADVRATWCA
jgi:hypothetical protein